MNACSLAISNEIQVRDGDHIVLPAAKNRGHATDATENRAKRPVSTMMHVRVDDRLKREATSTLESIGLSVPDAVRLFLRRVVIEKALPLRLDIPNEITERAMKESVRTDLTVFATAAELFDDLEKGGVR